MIRRPTLLSAAGALALALWAAPLCAADTPAAAAAQAPAAAPDPVVARVGDEAIHLSDLEAAASTLPPQARQMPKEELYPRLLEQMVDGRLLAADARRTGFDKDPKVQKILHDVQERTLVTAYLEREITPLVTDEAVKARFDKDGGVQKPEAEVHARHILVDDEATAKKIIAELKKGADFAKLSAQYSKDKAANEQGGDLGYFKAADMVPEFSTAAFALKDKEVSATPVHTAFGWHVIQTLDHRTSEPATFAKATQEQKNQVRQQMINDEVRRLLDRARADIKVDRFNLDGTPVRATDTATPPPAK